MHFDREPDRLEDIRESIALARQFIGTKTYDEFERDVMCVYAVTRCLEIVSGASRHVDGGFKQRHPELPWRQIAGAGNVYRHEYPTVRADIIWATVQQALPPLLAAITAELGPAA